MSLDVCYNIAPLGLVGCCCIFSEVLYDHCRLKPKSWIQCCVYASHQEALNKY